MIKNSGSLENWQKFKTIERIKNIKEKYLNKKSVLLDTQSHYEFIKNACELNNIKNFEVILLDCNDLVRNERLNKRGQSHLANQDITNWANFLREESKKYNYTLIDTSNHSIQEMADILRKIIS
ncbi:hypothetical protein CO033_00775 [Candidatus Nomurabacteria bacterium CG_4_9_14_0_2_um_filter_32_10]|uniref:Thymidylate kinase-like domain-containing protein n=2 Tax=Candidatus Nomuraibacteriota TaxID=1752729 RepID=A0A2H0CIF7_9BACT|nr:MAG: hypothetical protein COW91_01080 [Candidatus Nomurabacteria bacterium CG22_combo_CG10-13_8_21_14_all_32_8]PJC49580.1 MAG: hypothetical protein CO033_00775 [Candidatus Nomurabacteria bacterium CG_4_9_14_0_2_um_filter_32_10]